MGLSNEGVSVYVHCPYCGIRTKLSNEQLQDLLLTDKCVVDCKTTYCHKLYTVMVTDGIVFVNARK